MIDLPFNPDYTAHPGELAEMFMEDVGIDSAELARRMGVATQFVERLLAAAEDFAVGPSTAQKLGKAFGMPTQFWLNAEAGYREDLIRLTPKRVGLFDDWESFPKMKGNIGVALANRFIEDFLVKGGESHKRVAAALQDAGDYIILVESYEDRVFFEFKIGYGRGTYVALGPKLLLGLASDMALRHAPDRPGFRSGQERPSYDYTYTQA